MTLDDLVHLVGLKQIQIEILIKEVQTAKEHIRNLEQECQDAGLREASPKKEVEE